MKVWIVTGDDHDYDRMSQWCVGAFSSEEKAKEAVEQDRKVYKGHLKKRGGPNYEVFDVEIDEVVHE